MPDSRRAAGEWSAERLVRRLDGVARSPVPVALTWIKAVMDKGRLELAWPLTDPTLRLVLVQQWILEQGRRSAGGRGRDRLAAALAAEHPVDRRWPRFARWRVARWQAAWGDLGSARWGVRSRPEPAGVDLELVTLLRYEDGDPVGEPMLVEPGSARIGLRFIMRSVGPGQWRVAGFGGRLPRPGWPPLADDVSMDEEPGR